MKPEDFDQYRSEYPDNITGWHSRLYAEYPDQAHFNADVARMFFKRYDAGSVVEIGGWRGELATTILPNDGIVSWDNYEVCAEAVAQSVCTDPKYHAFNQRIVEPPSCDTLVMSHVIEHLSDQEVERLILSTDAELLYVDTPLSEAGEDWAGTTCFHTLKMGWSALDSLVRSEGYEWCGGFGTIRWYER